MIVVVCSLFWLWLCAWLSTSTFGEFLFSSVNRLMNTCSGLCDYCNIKQGWSVIFNSFDEYIDHVVNNHPGLKAYHDNKTDLHAFAERTRNEWEQFLKKRQKEYLKHLYGPGFVGLPSTL